PLTSWSRSCEPRRSESRARPRCPLHARTADLLLGKPLEDLLRFPHVDDTDPVIGLRDEVRDRARWRRPALLQAHLLKDLVVGVERCASECHVDMKPADAT